MKLMLDTVKYNQKPEGKGIGVISKRIIKYPTDINIQELANKVEQGYSFCPAFLNTKVDGKLHRRIECWTSQQVICLDFDHEMKLDDAVQGFRNSAAFIYTTFNHSEDEHRFRVVFVLDRQVNDYGLYEYIMNDLMSKYNCDQSCKDGSRLFFGGKDIIELDYDNVLCVDYYIEQYHNYNNNNNHNHKLNNIHIWDNASTLGLDLNTLVPYMDALSPSHDEKHRYTNVSLIKIKDIQELRKRLNIGGETLFNTHEEVYDYLKKQDLGLFLELPHGNFHCIFHEDKTPSANIYLNKETGHYMYKCFGENCTFKHGTIIKCTERLIKGDKVTSLRFLRKVFNVGYHETEWQRDQKEIIEENMRYIRSDDFPLEYPVQYKLIKPYLENLHTFLSLAKENLPSEQYTEDQKLPIFYTTMRQFANLCAQKDPRRLVKKLALFAFMCYFYKLSEDEIPRQLLKKAKFDIMKKKDDSGRDVMNIHSFFQIESFSEEVMTRAEGYARAFYDNHLTMEAWGWELLYRTFGEDEANRVYPQLKKKKISEYSHESASEIEKVIRNYIENVGWTTEKEVLNSVELAIPSMAHKRRQLKKILSELLNKYELKREKLSKKLQGKLGIPDQINENGALCYPVIIYKE